MPQNLVVHATFVTFKKKRNNIYTPLFLEIKPLSLFLPWPIKKIFYMSFLCCSEIYANFMLKLYCLSKNYLIMVICFSESKCPGMLIWKLLHKRGKRMRIFNPSQFWEFNMTYFCRMFRVFNLCCRVSIVYAYFW